MQRMGTVRAVLHTVPIEPLCISGPHDPENLCGLTIRQAPNP